MTEPTEIARASDLGIELRSSNDVAAVVGTALKHGGLLITQAELSPEFFDLRTGLAGEALQKLANYRARVAIVLGDREALSARFGEVMLEHRTHPLVRFFAEESEAVEWLRAERHQ